MRRESLIGWVGWKSRKVGPHRAAIGSSGGGPGCVRGGVRGGGGSGGGTERGEGLARGRWGPRLLLLLQLGCCSGRIHQLALTSSHTAGGLGGRGGAGAG